MSQDSPPPPSQDEPTPPNRDRTPAPEPDASFSIDPSPADGAAFPSLENEIALPPEAAELPAAPPRARRKPQDFTTRGLVLLWCLWLLGSWAMTMGTQPTLPNIRLMILAAAIGFLVLWPLLRLSQQVTRMRLTRAEPFDGGPAVLRARATTGGASAGSIFGDWLSLIAVFQAVLWPLPLTTGWTLNQALWLDAAMAAWSLLVAAVVALGCASDAAARRTVAMAIVLLLLVGEPVVMAAMNADAARAAGTTWLMRVSPLQAVWEMTGKPQDWRPDRWRERVIAVACAAALAWGIVLIARRRTSER